MRIVTLYQGSILILIFILALIPTFGYNIPTFDYI